MGEHSLCDFLWKNVIIVDSLLASAISILIKNKFTKCIKNFPLQFLTKELHVRPAFVKRYNEPTNQKKKKKAH